MGTCNGSETTSRIDRAFADETVVIIRHGRVRGGTDAYARRSATRCTATYECLQGLSRTYNKDCRPDVSRVLRGGSWDDYPGYLRSAYRFGIQPGFRGSCLGFRVARTL